jgi:dolichol-phosphate mannosyltransferase
MQRWARFVGIGLVGFAAQLAVLEALTRLGVPYALAAAIAVEFAILQNFVWHEQWTWKDRRVGTCSAVAVRLVRFNAASGAVSILGNVALTVLLVETAHLPVLLANVLAVASLTFVNYTVADRFVFRSGLARRTEDLPAEAGSHEILM